MIDVSAYLSRIRYTGPREPTESALRGLQRAHLFAVPFENLDINLGRPINLEPSNLFDKIVTRRRGGYCFELNGLFALLLEALGFRVTRLSASSANDDGSYKPEFEHLALMVYTAENPETAWLVDVGWGDGPVEPLRLVGLGAQECYRRVYRLRPKMGFFILEEKLAQGGWLTHYRFNLVPHELDEFSEMNRYLQTSPESMFTQKRLCTLFLPGGRVTCSDLRLVHTWNHGLRGTEKKEERVLSDEAEVHQVIRDVFGVELLEGRQWST